MGQGQAPQPEGPGPSPEVMLPTCSLSGLCSSTLLILLLESRSNFPQALILLILSLTSPWYVFYLLF